MMTNWLPDLARAPARSICGLPTGSKHDIDSGALPPATKLPPQRDLAFDIGVTIGTVGRAYALVRERGLVSGEVGRGTFVLGARKPTRRTAPEALTPTGWQVRALWMQPVESCAWTAPRRPSRPERSIEAVLATIILRDHPDEVARLYAHISASLVRGRQPLAGRATAFGPAPDTIVSTLGAHAGGASAVIAAMTAPGDKIAFEHLTYS